jgi:hypothetical protein
LIKKSHKNPNFYGTLIFHKYFLRKTICPFIISAYIDLTGKIDVVDRHHLNLSGSFERCTFISLETS